MNALKGVAVLNFTLRKLLEGIDIFILDNARRPQISGLNFLRFISSINLK